MNQYLDERCSKIMKILLENKEPITTNELARKLNVSNRTIRYDLEKLDDLLNKYEGVKIEKKSRVGIWLKCRDDMVRPVKDMVYTNKTYIKPFSTEERKIYIIRELIQAPDIIKMQNLANDLYVSRITIHNDLNEVEEWLGKFDLKLIKKQNYGLQILGEEKNWRKATSALLGILKNSEELKSIITDTEELHSKSRLNYKSFKKIQELISEIDLHVIETILNEAEFEFSLSLTDEAFEGLCVHIAISIRRLNSKNDVQLTQNQLLSIKEAKEYEVGEWIANRFKNEFDIEFSVSEIAYLTLHILGSKIHENIQKGINNKIVDTVDNKLKLFVNDVINLISNILNCNLCSDERLYNGLILHLRPAINRMTYGLSLRNPMINEIKSKIPAIFGASWATSTLFENYYQIKVSEEEIGYIAMHVGAALERLNTSVKGIVVCGSGIGTCELVAARLNRQISNLNIIGTFSLYDIKVLDKNSFDLIVTTIPMKNAEGYGKPIVNISPLTTDEDISNIRKVVNDIELTSRSSNICNEDLVNHKQKLFYDKFILAKESTNNKINIITKLSNMLIDEGFVDKGFLESVIERERLTSTAVGNSIALPHGGEAFVKKSCIAIASLEKPIDWGNGEVDIIFLLALRLEDRNYVKRFFSYFYSIIDDDDILDKIRNSSTKDGILNLISNYK